MDLMNMSIEELFEQDLEYCIEVINREKRNLWFNEEAKAWYIGEDEIPEYLWKNENTILNPKELIGRIERYIENETNIMPQDIKLQKRLQEILETIKIHPV